MSQGPEQAHIQVDRKQIVEHDDEPFDRVRFALEALRVCKPPEMAVAVYEGRFQVRTEAGRDPRRGPKARWGILAVPRHASRADIAIAVATLTGRAHDPYLIDVLLSQGVRLG